MIRLRFSVKLLSGECHNTSLIISQHWFRLWLGAVRQQAITWANIDIDLCRHMATQWVIIFVQEYAFGYVFRSLRIDVTQMNKQYDLNSFNMVVLKKKRNSIANELGIRISHTKMFGMGFSKFTIRWSHLQKSSFGDTVVGMQLL